MAAFSNAGGTVVSCIANAALSKCIRVKLSGSTVVRNVAAAGVGATDATYGITLDNAASGDPIPVLLLAGAGSVRMTASGAITLNAAVYGAASGKISATVSGNPIGWATEAATADGDIIGVDLSNWQTV